MNQGTDNCDWPIQRRWHVRWRHIKLWIRFCRLKRTAYCRCVLANYVSARKRARAAGRGGLQRGLGVYRFWLGVELSAFARGIAAAAPIFPDRCTTQPDMLVPQSSFDGRDSPATPGRRKKDAQPQKDFRFLMIDCLSSSFSSNRFISTDNIAKDETFFSISKRGPYFFGGVASVFDQRKEKRKKRAENVNKETATTAHVQRQKSSDKVTSRNRRAEH